MLFLSFLCNIFLGITGKLELVYALDTSIANNPDDIRRIKYLAKATLRLYNISSQMTRIALVSYGNNTKMVLKLLDGTTESVAKSAFENVPIISGESRIDKMIDFVRKKVFSVSGGSLPTSKKLLLIITKGNIKNIYLKQLKKKTVLLKKNGVQISIVSIAPDKSEDLRKVADNHIAYVPNTKDLPKVYPDIEQFVGNALGKEFMKFY